MVPLWIMRALGVTDGTELLVQTIELPRGSFAKLQPLTDEFATSIADHKATLEAALMHTYTTLIKAYGQTRQLDQAWNLWTEVTERKGLAPTEHLYSQMIDALVTNDYLDDALQLFEETGSRRHSEVREGVQAVVERVTWLVRSGSSLPSASLAATKASG